MSAAARGVELARRGAGRLELGWCLAAHAQTRHACGQDAAPLLEEARRTVRGSRDPGWVPERLARLGRSVSAATPRKPHRPQGELSDRERELLPLLAGTLSQREIGAALHVSLNTVKTHSRLLYRKLGVSSREEAVGRARELGLLWAGHPGPFTRVKTRCPADPQGCHGARWWSLLRHLPVPGGQ